MANVSYPQLDKTIIQLPLDFDFINQFISDDDNYLDFKEAYFKKYGIDLDDVIKFELKGLNGYIRIDKLVLLVDVTSPATLPTGTIGRGLKLFYQPSSQDSVWTSGGADATITISLHADSEQLGWGFRIAIPRSDDFEKENATMSVVEY